MRKGSHQYMECDSSSSFCAYRECFEGHTVSVMQCNSSPIHELIFSLKGVVCQFFFPNGKDFMSGQLSSQGPLKDQDGVLFTVLYVEGPFKKLLVEQTSDPEDTFPLGPSHKGQHVTQPVVKVKHSRGWAFCTLSFVSRQKTQPYLIPRICFDEFTIFSLKVFRGRR